jgi:D-3-phosphoglycerate dehydrogenase
MSTKVLIATRSFGSTSETPWKLLAENHAEIVRLDINKATEQELAAALREVDAAIIGARLIRAEVIAGAPRLKVICMHGVGVDHIDLEAARAHQVVVCNCPGANADSVADLAFCLMLMVSRDVLNANASLKRGEWGRYSGTVVVGKTLGLIGMGRIGQAVTQRALGFHMRVLAYDPFVPPQNIEEIGAKTTSLGELLAEADYVSLHAPVTDETRTLINADTLGKMKSTAFFINTSRGELVDEEALYQALKNHQIAGAGLDVFSEEPPTRHDLINLPNVIATPHIGAHSTEAITNVSIMAAQNVISALQGEPINQVN